MEEVGAYTINRPDADTRNRERLRKLSVATIICPKWKNVIKQTRTASDM